MYFWLLVDNIEQYHIWINTLQFGIIFIEELRHGILHIN